MTDIIGALVGNPQIETAVLDTLRYWLPRVYLPEVETQNGLAAGTITPPPDDTSYIGGLDFLTVQQDRCPQIIAIVNPAGDPELDVTIYGQTYEVQVGAIVITQDEDSARTLAGHYGAAIIGALTQNGDLGGLATRLRLMGAPRTDFIDPEIRNLVKSVATFHVFVWPILDEAGGPATPPDPPGNYPTVQTVNTTVTGEALS